MFTAQQYVRPASIEEAYALNQKITSAILGGGCWLRLGKRRIGTLIDLSALGLDSIEETEREITVGAMVTLRQLETSGALGQSFGSGFARMTEHIVGVQFRNCATLGGSLAARFGFSDVLTWLLALDCQVELAGAGRISLAAYAQMPHDRDILLRLILQKNGRKAVYESFRNTQTDLPVLTCAVSTLDGDLRIVLGARPSRAAALDGLSLSIDADAAAKAAQAHFSFGTNMRASADYRRHLAGVLVRRAVTQLQEAEQ
ncbi:MAG TPA: FAD binding domain-containing protein [Candidatus Faecousia intestinigallinarum]|nr:FAD binding domain-containing protein [Candidatus Faecousia intestinigallinarum]